MGLVVRAGVAAQVRLEDTVLRFVDAKALAELEEQVRLVGRNGVLVLPRHAQDELVEFQIVIPLRGLVPTGKGAHVRLVGAIDDVLFEADDPLVSFF